MCGLARGSLPVHRHVTVYAFEGILGLVNVSQWGCAMASGIDVSQLLATYSNPDSNDPYLFNGISHAPQTYSRVFRTPEDVVRHLAQAKITRRMDDADIIARCGVSADDLARLISCGEGSPDTFLAVTEALGISPVHMPGNIVFGR